MGQKFIHIPTGKVYSCYSSGLYEDNMSNLMVWMNVRRGRKPSEYIKLPWREVTEIRNK